MSHTQRVTEGERLDPAKAFSIIGNETRLQILQILFDEKAGPPMTFSDLRKCVGMRDGSQFNYHLKKLEGPFVRKTDEGYRIRLAGIHVILSVVEGSFTDHPRIAPFETGGTCVECDEPLLAEYEDEMLYVTCSSCGTMHTMGMFPPAAVANRTDQEVLTAFDRWQRHDFALSADGVCSVCGGVKSEILIRDTDEMVIYLGMSPTEFQGFDFGIRYQCDQCDAWDYGTPGKHLLTHPDIVAFHWDHGVDLHAVPYWELDWVINNRRTTVLGEDPLRVLVAIPLDDEELRVTLDETFGVCEVERALGAF